MFTLSKLPTSQKGQVILRVLKDGKEDKGGNAYFQQQMPEDLAKHILELQSSSETTLDEINQLKKNQRILVTEVEKMRNWVEDEASRWNDGCGCCGKGETAQSSINADKEIQEAIAETNATGVLTK